MSDASGNELEKEFECYAAIVSIEETLIELNELMATEGAGALAKITSSIDALRKLADIAIEAKEVDLKDSLLELRKDLLDAKENLLNSREEMLNLREQNGVLKARVEKLEKLSQVELDCRGDAYYKKEEDHPICMTCLDSKEQIIHLIKADISMPDMTRYQCGQCNNSVWLEGNKFYQGQKNPFEM